MSFSLRKLEHGKTDKTIVGYNSASFRVMLEAHLENIRKHQDTQTMEMEGNRYKMYTGDLAGWLLSREVAPNYHWIIARLNGYASPNDYDGKLRSFKIPSKAYIDELLQIHRTSYTSM